MAPDPPPAPTLDAYEFALRALGNGLGFRVASAWEPGEDTRLRCVSIWCADPERVAPFIEATRSMVMGPGEGVPGRVYESGEPLWLIDAGANPTLPRREAARTSGLHTVVAFPVRSERGVVGVVELATDVLRKADPELTELLVSLGVQLGHLVERRAAERAVEESEAHTQAILDAALDSVVTIDAEGTVVAFNPAAQRTFGYTIHEAIGANMAELIVPPDLRERHRAGLERYLATGEPTLLGQRIEIEAVDSTGRRFPVELAITRVAGEGPPLFSGYLRDITDRYEAQRELLASRARIVAAADEARRRLERDLHDGAQQRLVGLALMLRLARNKVKDGSEAAGLIDEATVELADATAELRELARGIHPAVLTDGGLEPALRALAARSSVPVAIERVPSERLPSPVESAAYMTVAEALTNVARYSGADHADVDVWREHGALVVEVSDNGGGGADIDNGSGLRGLTDRIAAIGGTLRIDSPSGRGTTLRAEMPCVS
jgi:PAS domain S-box-containing protein